MTKDSLRVKQDAAAQIGERLLQSLLLFDPVDRITVGDVKYIAEIAKTKAFDVINEVYPDDR